MRTLYLLLLLILSTSLSAQTPKWLKKARRAQVTILAYDEADKMRQGQGFFLDEAGTVLVDFDLMKGARRATLTTADNHPATLLRLVAGSSLYNVARFTTDTRKAVTLEPTTSASLRGDVVYILPVPTVKEAPALRDTIAAIEPFGTGYTYYQLSGKPDPRLTGAPVLTEEGRLIGMAQVSGKALCVLPIDYALSLATTALDANNADYRDIPLPLLLPEAEEQAATFLYLARNSPHYGTYLADFIALHPRSAVGYTLKAEDEAAREQYDQAEETYRQGLEAHTGKDDELHYSLAKTLYQRGLKGDTLLLPRALDEARQANAIAPNPLYTAMEGFTLYALRQYDEAYQRFRSLSQTNLRSAEYWFYAAQCREKAGADKAEVLALQDSALATFTRPYTSEAANYLMLRAQTLKAMERYRDAVADYNEYEHLRLSSLTGNFYYEREQLELRCRMYEQALADIRHAVTLTPREPLFRAEQAAVCYRLSLFDEAIAACQEAIRLDDTFGDAYRIWGLCLRQTGDTAGARQRLQQAIDRGDELAGQLIIQN